MEQSTKSIQEQEIITVQQEMPKKSGFDDFITKYYLNWQLANGRASIREFSKWLGVNHSLVVQWMNDKGLPGPKYIPRLVSKMGPGVLEYVNDPLLPSSVLEMTITLGQLPIADRTAFEDDFEQWLGTWLEKHGFKREK
jgi:hypothetical protein